VKRTGNKQDGCATFFKKLLFECEAEVPVTYFVPCVAPLDRDNVALLLLLRPKLPAPSAAQTRAAKLCVANTHLLFNPGRGDVKLAQLMKLFAEIDQLAYQPCPAGPRHQNHYPVLVCGDMNLLPFSKLYQFVRSGYLVLNGKPASKMSGQQDNWSRGYNHSVTADFLGKHSGLTDQSQYVSVCQQRFSMFGGASCTSVGEGAPCASSPQVEAESVPGMYIGSAEEKPIYTLGSGVLSHALGLESVYSHFIGPRGSQNQLLHNTPREVTTCHGNANCTVDYIFYTPSLSALSHSDMHFGYSWTAMTNSTKLANKAASHTAVSLSSSDISNVLQQPSVSSMMTPCHVADYRLTLLARLQLLSTKQVKSAGRLPNRFISSDHLILAAKFRLTYD